MSRRIFDTYHAPDEETAGVKAALDAADVDWYETVKGRWWVGSAGLWVRKDEDHDLARSVIDQFQKRWVTEQREASPLREVKPTINWARVPVVIVVTGLLLYLMTFWFWL